jgi:hypothetical protein
MKFVRLFLAGMLLSWTVVSADEPRALQSSISVSEFTFLHTVDPQQWSRWMRLYYDEFKRERGIPQVWLKNRPDGIWMKSVPRVGLEVLDADQPEGLGYNLFYQQAYYQDHSGGQMPILIAVNPLPSALWYGTGSDPDKQWDLWINQNEHRQNRFAEKQIEFLRRRHRLPWHSEFYRELGIVGVNVGFPLLLNPGAVLETRIFIPHGETREETRLEQYYFKNPCMSSLKEMGLHPYLP